jgi:hypothetical protein
MISPEQPVIRCPPAGEQEQRHVDAKGLLKQRHHTCGAIQTAGLDGAPQALARLIGEGNKQHVEALLQQGLGWRHPAELFKADIQAVFADAKSLWDGRNLDRLVQMQRKILACHGNDLHRTSASFWSSLRSQVSQVFTQHGHHL